MWNLRNQRKGTPKPFLRDERGVTIIEFALIAPVFLALIFTTIEFSLILFLRGSIEDATHQVARLGITGSTYGQSGDRQEILMGMLEERLQGIVFNPENFTITSEVYANYNNATEGNAEDNTGNVFGGSNQVVRYQVTYQHDYITPVGTMVDLGTGLTITSTVFVKNEEF